MAYETREELDDTGLAHLFDDESAGFPLCGTNFRPNKGVSRRALCMNCREAAAREEQERTPTPIEVWAPAFAKILPEKLTTGAIFSASEDWRVPGEQWCILCETWVRLGERRGHARQHDRERREFNRKVQRARKREDAARLRELNRLKRETDRALADGDTTSSPSGRPNGRSKPEEEEQMSTTAKETPDVSGLYETLTARIKEQIAGVKVESKKNKAHAYAAIEVEGKNVGYVSQGKRGVSVQIRKGSDAGTRSVKSEREVGSAVTALAKVADTVRSAEPKAPAVQQAKSAPKSGGGKNPKRRSKKTAPVAA